MKRTLPLQTLLQTIELSRKSPNQIVTVDDLQI